MRLWGRQAQQGPCMLATPSLPVGLHVPPAGLSDPGEQVEHRHRLLCRAGFAEDIPEPQGLIPSSSDDGLPIRGHGQVEDTIRVSSELGHLCKGRVLPHEDLVL